MSRRIRTVARWLLTLSMVGVGVTHFTAPEGFVRIVPPWLPAPLVLVYVSGVFEILGGLGLVLARTRRAAGVGLVALYVAVFPANLHMALHGVSFSASGPTPAWLLWARLPLQAVFIVWALWVSREDPARSDTARSDTGTRGPPT